MTETVRELIVWAMMVVTAINAAMLVVQGTWGARVKALEADNDRLLRHVAAQRGKGRGPRERGPLMVGYGGCYIPKSGWSPGQPARDQ